MTYDTESKLRAYLRGQNWDQTDIATVVRTAGRCNNVREAKQHAANWLRYKSTVSAPREPRR